MVVRVPPNDAPETSLIPARAAPGSSFTRENRQQMAPRAPSPPSHPLPPLLHPRIRDVSSSDNTHTSQDKADSLNAPSISPSNEADDERSEDEDDEYMRMGPNDDGLVERPAYEGEDTRLTGTNELRGFFLYGWAAEVRLTTLPQMDKKQEELTSIMYTGLCGVRHGLVHTDHAGAACTGKGTPRK